MITGTVMENLQSTTKVAKVPQPHISHWFCIVQ